MPAQPILGEHHQPPVHRQRALTAKPRRERNPTLAVRFTRKRAHAVGWRLRGCLVTPEKPPTAPNTHAATPGDDRRSHWVAVSGRGKLAHTERRPTTAVGERGELAVRAGRAEVERRVKTPGELVEDRCEPAL
jgi:hypothetical protein